MAEDKGFTPSRNQTGGSSFRSHVYTVASTNGENLFPGDVVKLVGGFIEACSGSNLEQPVGVLKAVYTATGRPLTHNAPDNGQFRLGTTSAANRVDVYDDPNTVFKALANATAGTANFGQAANVSAGAGDTTMGQSRHVVNIADATSTTVSASAGGAMFRVIGLDPAERGVFSGTNGVEVVFNKHIYGGGGAS